MRFAAWLCIPLLGCGGINDGANASGADASAEASNLSDGSSLDGARLADGAPNEPPVVGSPCTGVATTLSSVHGRADQIALDEGFVYFHDEAGVSRVPKGGGPTRLVASASSTWWWPQLSAFALSGSRLRWTDAVGYTWPHLRQVDKQGDNAVDVKELWGGAYASVAFAADGSSYAWGPFSMVTVDGNGVMSNPFSFPGNSERVAIDGTTFFAAAEYGVFQITKGVTTSVAAIRAFDLAFDATDLYFTDHCHPGEPCNLPIVSVADGQVWRVARSGGAPTAIATGVGLLGGLSLDAGNVYFADRSNGQVVRVAKDASAKAVVGQSRAGEQAIDVAVDDTCVYWTSTASAPDGTSHIQAAPK